MPKKVFDTRDDVARHNASQPIPTVKYEHMNHHHELTPEHELVSMGGVEFVANKAAIPALKSLHDLGLRTRTHHVDENGGFISILLDDHVDLEIRKVEENDSTRSNYNGQTEILIRWRTPMTPTS